MAAHMQSDRRLIDVEHVMEAFERIRQRIEVLARADIVYSQGLHDLIARCAEELFVKDHREVCIVRLDILLDGVELQTIDVAETFAIARHCLAAFRDLFIDMTQIADAHRRAELIHLRIGTDSIHLLRATDAEVLQAVEFLTKLLITEAGCTTLDRVEDLRRMEAETRDITKSSRALTLVLDTKRMCRIIDDLQLILVGNPLNLLDIADIAIDMHRHDSARAVRDQRLELVHVHREILRIDVAEHRRQAIADNRMCRRGKRERRRDDLTLQIHRLQRKLQRHMAIREQVNVLHAEILTQTCLQSLMLHTHIRQPAAVPDILDFIHIFIHRRHRRSRY